jgi:hypothetical protein
MRGRVSALAAGLVMAGAIAVPSVAGQAAVPVRLEPLDASTFSRRYTPAQIQVLEKLNRRDVEHLLRVLELLVPTAWREDELDYSPLPREWAWAAAAPKVAVVHQAAQVFGAYEAGRLVRWGPVSSGRQETPTPTGVFNLTWKSRSRTSTDNDQWLLKWYFNFSNARGVSFHQFELPGRAASHACVRLLARDAEWFYFWGEQWRLSPDGRTVVTPGTPVVVLGEFNFTQPAPWLTPEAWLAPLALPDDPGRSR